MTSKVCVLLCTYNGEKYLKEQIESLRRQEEVELDIIAHDDGSSDGTVHILNEYNIPVFGEEHLGAAHGFFYLMETAPDADYYAFCDQDDKWDPDKLIVAVRSMENAVGRSGLQKPMLYGSGTRLVAEDGSFISNHRADPERSLTSRLFYSSISGNTMVFNRSMREIALLHQPEEMIMHDSWLLKLCIAVGGKLVIDSEPHMDYRMHGNNTIGMELDLRQKAGKFRTVVSSSGEGQELIDICSMYGLMVKPEYRKLAEDTLLSRTDAKVRRTFVKDHGIDFKSRGFNMAFAMKVKKGNL